MKTSENSSRSQVLAQISNTQSTREELAQTRQNKTEKITGLKSKSEIVMSVWQETIVSTRSKWFSVQEVSPKNIFNFTLRYFNNTLAN